MPNFYGWSWHGYCRSTGYHMEVQFLKEYGRYSAHDGIVLILKKLLLFLARFILRIRLTGSNWSTETSLWFLSISLEKTTIIYLDNTSTLDRSRDSEKS